MLACANVSKEPPPAEVVKIYHNVETGFITEDVDIFCQDFADIMFNDEYTKSKYLSVIKDLKSQLGDLENSTYFGKQKDNIYIWQLTFSEGKLKLVLVINKENKISGLWFRK